MAMQPLTECPPSPGQSGVSRKSRTLAALRIVLGLGQVVGAGISLILLLQTGVNRLSVWAAAVTGLLVWTSLWVFRRGTQVPADRHP